MDLEDDTEDACLQFPYNTSINSQTIAMSIIACNEPRNYLYTAEHGSLQLRLKDKPLSELFKYPPIC